MNQHGAKKWSESGWFGLDRRFAWVGRLRTKLSREQNDFGQYEASTGGPEDLQHEADALKIEQRLIDLCARRAIDQHIARRRAELYPERLRTNRGSGAKGSLDDLQRRA